MGSNTSRNGRLEGWVGSHCRLEVEAAVHEKHQNVRIFSKIWGSTTKKLSRRKQAGLRYNHVLSTEVRLDFLVLSPQISGTNYIVASNTICRFYSRGNWSCRNAGRSDVSNDN